jgi:hypothetical protein
MLAITSTRLDKIASNDFGESASGRPDEMPDTASRTSGGERS